jgi:hypothetical protein
MPYFRCQRCALRLYSAAHETQCTKCNAPLGAADQLLETTPLARPHRTRGATAWALARSADERGAG